jgi:hypothetical protein
MSNVRSQAPELLSQGWGVLKTIKFFSVQTETQSVSVVFQFVSQNQKTFFRIVSVFRTSIETTETNRFCRNKQKNLQKTFSIRGSSKPLIFFLGSNRIKPKLSLFRLFLGLLFRETKDLFFQFVLVCFDVSDQY